MPCDEHNIGIKCNPVVTTAIHDLEKRVISPGCLKHFRIQVFVPVVTLERSEKLCIKEESSHEPRSPREKKGTDG
jgi:hypothetical protein